MQVVLDPSPESKARFFEAQARRALTPEEQVRALSLLDMQRQCLLMYTSCGWFFNDLSGIETVQILKYAARAMDNAADLGLRSARTGFLYLLSQAECNVREHGNGENLFHKMVEPSRVSLERLAAHFAIMALAEVPTQGRLGGWTWAVDRFERMRRGGQTFASGRVQLESPSRAGATTAASWPCTSAAWISCAR